MTTTITTIQEITLQAYVLGIYNILHDSRGLDREEIFNLFEEWGREFEAEADKHLEDPDWLYYDEIDLFLEAKKKELCS